MVAAAIGGGERFDLHRYRGVEHEVHNIPANSFPKCDGSLAHEFNDRFLAVGLKPGTVRDPKVPVTTDSYREFNMPGATKYPPRVRVRLFQRSTSTHRRILRRSMSPK